MTKWFVVIGLVTLLIPIAAHADVSLLVLESVGVSGEYTGGGHAAVYLSNICSDDAISLRPCREGESGVVISSYPEFADGTEYKWMAVPLTSYLYGVADQKDVPIYANGDIRNFLREKYRAEHLNALVPASADGSLPAGGWRTMLTMAFNRDIYGITVRTTADEDRRFLHEFNSEPNRGNFSTWTNNCADFVRKTINKYFPGATRRDWINDFGITTPKAVARSLYKYAKKRPERLMYMSRFPQVQGPIWRSYDIRNFTEMGFKSKKYLIPSLIFKPSVALIFAGTYYLTGRFDIHKAYTEYPTHELARLKAQRATGGDPRITYFVPTGGRAEIEEKIRLERNNVLGEPRMWREYRAMLVPILKNAVAQGLFKDDKEVKTFFRDLELQSEPALDENGQLILRVKYYGTERLLGITRGNLLAPGSDRELALKLILARLNADLNADEKNRGHYRELLDDWLIMRRLTADPSLLAGVDKARGRFVTTRPPESGKRKLEKLVIAITH